MRPRRGNRGRPASTEHLAELTPPLQAPVEEWVGRPPSRGDLVCWRTPRQLVKLVEELAGCHVSGDEAAQGLFRNKPVALRRMEGAAASQTGQWHWFREGLHRFKEEG
jgi:hypothetical protein